MEYSLDVDTRHKCAYEPCQCQIPTTQEYCSDFCSDADDVDEVDRPCPCKHAPCALNRVARDWQCVTDANAVRGEGR